MARTGIGIDSHAFAPGRKLILGGVEIPYERGLRGFSDADVLAHAITDALLGAAGLGDIGQHFPDTDEQWRGADSMELLKVVVARLGAIEHVDCTVMMERPKLSPHRDAIRAGLEAVLGCTVNVKATTGEGMGFVGRGEGVAALAVATLLDQGRVMKRLLKGTREMQFSVDAQDRIFQIATGLRPEVDFSEGCA